MTFVGKIWNLHWLSFIPYKPSKIFQVVVGKIARNFLRRCHVTDDYTSQHDAGLIAYFGHLSYGTIGSYPHVISDRTIPRHYRMTRDQAFVADAASMTYITMNAYTGLFPDGATVVKVRPLNDGMAQNFASIPYNDIAEVGHRNETSIDVGIVHPPGTDDGMMIYEDVISYDCTFLYHSVSPYSGSFSDEHTRFDDGCSMHLRRSSHLDFLVLKPIMIRQGIMNLKKQLFG